MKRTLRLTMPKFLILLACCLACVNCRRGGERAGASATPLPTASGEKIELPQDYGRRINRTSLWQKPLGNVVHGFCNMYQFEVVHDSADRSYPFKAWFFGWITQNTNPGQPGCDAVCAARSAKLDSGWEVFGGDGRWDKDSDPACWQTVMVAGNSYYDEWHNGDPSVVKVGETFYMAFSSTGHNKDRIPHGQPGDSDGDLSCVMGATSTDGIHWRKSAAPILANPGDFGAKPYANGCAHEGGSFHRPAVLYEDGRFKMWFDCWLPAGIAMCYAENDGDFLDPGDWRILRGPDNPCLGEFPNPDVVRIEDVYFAYADPGVFGDHPWKRRMITEAVSTNGADWVVLGYVDPDPDTPAIHVPQAYVKQEGADVWMYVFYACQIGGEPYDYRYDRIRYMRRRITRGELEFCRRICRPAPKSPAQ